MKDWLFNMALWIYGLLFSLLGGSFLYLSKQKQDKSVCDAIHEAADKRNDSIDKKMDYLITKLDKFYELYVLRRMDK